MVFKVPSDPGHSKISWYEGQSAKGFKRQLTAPAESHVVRFSILEPKEPCKTFCVNKELSSTSVMESEGGTYAVFPSRLAQTEQKGVGRAGTEGSGAWAGRFCRKGQCIWFVPKVHSAQHLCLDSCQQWISEGEVRTGQACRASALGILQASDIL